MAYPTLTLHLLISAPSDVPTEDLSTVHTTINGWNVRYGRAFGLSVVPVSWTAHAVSEFGDRPQELLNKQIVREADLALALFADRLGTATGVAESGTAEEIKEMAEAGKHVSVLRNVAPRPSSTGVDAAQERVRLENYLTDLRAQALVLTYADQAELARHVENLLSRQATQFRDQSTEGVTAPREASGEGDGASPRAGDGGVWPRVEVNESVRTDSKGRVKTHKNWYLVLENLSPHPAHNVAFAIEPEKPDDPPFDVLGRDEPPIETLPPGGQFRYPIALSMGSALQARCRVTWEDNGHQRENVATVRSV